jgi:hypothetical protein
MTNNSDVNAELAVLEKPVRRHDVTAFQCMPLRVEDGVFTLGRPPIETMRQSGLLLQRLENCELHSAIVWPRTRGRRVPESRANAG